MFAQVRDGVVVIPDVPTNVLIDGVLISNVTETVRRANGYYTVIESASPVVPAGQTLDLAYEFIDGEVEQVWTLRARNVDEQRKVNRISLIEPVSLAEDMTMLKTFLTDPDIQVLLDQPNNSALTNNQLNRGLKAIVRQLRRNANYTMRESRVLFSEDNPALLDDISDTNVT